MSSDGPRADAVDEAMTNLFGVGICLVNDSSRRILETLYDKAFQKGVEIEAAEQLVDQAQGTQTRLRRIRPV